MIRLLGRLRREMNGAVADSMRFYGNGYGLNYGVSIPTIRTIARDEGRDHDFARYLYIQQVRELRLAALHIADPAALDLSEAGFWGGGIINSEVAEEAAFALLSRSEALPEIFEGWCASGSEMEAYAALMAGARARIVRDVPAACDAAAAVLGRYPQSHIAAVGVATLMGAAFDGGDMSRETAASLLASLPPCKASSYVADEMAWRMEVV